MVNHQFFSFAFSTAPPGPPRALETIHETDATITIAWSCPDPTTAGISDTYYIVCYGSAIDFIRVCDPPVLETSCENIYVISGLSADSSYFIDVQSLNGVSDQDPDNDIRRNVETFGITTEGGMRV